MDNVIYPTLDYLEIEGNPYLGILGVNGVLTDDGKIFVLGWHSFMQDCDASAILEILDEDLYELFDSCIIGSFSDEADTIRLNDKFAASLVLNCKISKILRILLTGWIIWMTIQISFFIRQLLRISILNTKQMQALC